MNIAIRAAIAILSIASIGTARWCMNTRTLTVIPDGKAHIARTKAELAILMPER